VFLVDLLLQRYYIFFNLRTISLCLLYNSITKKPEGEQVTQRAIPTEVFAANSAVQQKFIRKWLNDPTLMDCSLRSIVDWDYYRGRITSQIHKLITLPAYYQVRNLTFAAISQTHNQN